MVDQKLSELLKNHKDVPDEIILDCRIYDKAFIRLRNNGITRVSIPVKWNKRFSALEDIAQQVYKKYKELGIWQ